MYSAVIPLRDVHRFPDIHSIGLSVYTAKGPFSRLGAERLAARRPKASAAGCRGCLKTALRGSTVKGTEE